MSKYLFSPATSCGVYARQAEMLAAHLDGPQPVPRDGRARRTMRSLVERGWLAFDPQEGVTTLKQHAVPHAMRSADMLAEQNLVTLQPEICVAVPRINPKVPA